MNYAYVVLIFIMLDKDGDDLKETNIPVLLQLLG